VARRLRWRAAEGEQGSRRGLSIGENLLHRLAGRAAL